MLVLSRKVGQKIVIGENIKLVVTRISGNRVTLGIEAPEDVRVLRGELDQPSMDESDAPRSQRPRLAPLTVGSTDEAPSDLFPRRRAR